MYVSVRCSSSRQGFSPGLHLIPVIALTAALILSFGTRPARAAAIPVDLTGISAVGLLSGTNDVPTVVDDDNGVSKLSNLYNASWAEFPVTIGAGQGGVFTVSGKYGTPHPQSGDLGMPVAIQIDIRKAGTEEHIVSQDLVLPATGSDLAAYQPTAAFSAPGFNLPAGDYVLRVQNVSLLHSTISNRAPAYDWRGEIGATQIRRVDIGSLSLDPTGALPATGTISGKISASDLGYPVGGAHVMAVPAGQDVAEPSPLWNGGHWTITDADGNYSLTVPAGATYTVVAGRPDSYQVGGARATDVAVTAGQTAKKDLSLTSRWTATDGSGQLTVELEYFFNKVPDLASTPWTQLSIAADGNASNQIKVTWTGGGDYADVYVDVPTGQAGEYDLTCLYSSYPGGNISFIANPDTPESSTIVADLPNSSADPGNLNNGYWQSATVKYPDPITLKAGRNVVRVLVNSGGIDFDAFKLDKHIPDVVVPGVANPRNANFVWAIGEDANANGDGGDVMYPEKTGNSITRLSRGSYVEIPMTFSEPGMYKVDLTTKGYGPNPLIQLDLRGASSTTHYATDDTPVPASSTAFSPVTIANIPVLQSGDYILRVRNTTQFHTTRETRSSFNAYVGGKFVPNRLDFGQLTFTKTGALPATGNISGTVKSSNIGNVPVGEAVVLANPPGAGAPEPSILWQKGFWTQTDASGAYTLTVTTGTYDVQAGQAAMYIYGGATRPTSVSGGGSATANIDLPSRVTQDATGHYEINVETEYFVGKNVDPFGPGWAGNVIALQENSHASNGLAPGWTDAGNYLDIPIDVPAGAAGQYTVTDYYFNGYYMPAEYPDGTVSLTANLDTGDMSTTSDIQPNTAPTNPDGTRQPSNTGYNTPGVKVFEQPIQLITGHNTIRIKLETGSSNFDAFKLTSQTAFPFRPSALRALRITAGLEPAPTPASGDVYKGLDATGDGSITVSDVVKLFRQGWQ